MYLVNGVMEATLYLPSDTYYIESAHKYAREAGPHTHVVYRASDLIFDFRNTTSKAIEGVNSCT